MLSSIDSVRSTTAGRPPQRRGLSMTAAVWVLVLTSSALPHILYAEVTGSPSPWWLGGAQAVVLTAAMVVVRTVDQLRALTSALQWLVAMVLGWNVVISTVTASEAWQGWQHEVPWVVRGAAFQLMLCLPTLLLVLLGPGRLGRARLRLQAGDSDRAAGRGLYTAGRRPRWRVLGAAWACLFTAGTVIAMVFAVGSKASDVVTLAWSMPVIAVLAATNTFNEEFGFRNVPLAVLPEVVGVRQAVLATGLLFGLAHYYGNPPGASGVLLATFLGVLLAKSMVETGGSRWAWLIHWLQDMVIFSFLAAAWTSL